MKMYSKCYQSSLIIIFIAAIGLSSCSPAGEGKSSRARKQDSIIIIESNIDGAGKAIGIEMVKGKEYNHPSFVFWIEDMGGNYIQTLFVTRAIGQGIFSYGDKSSGIWKPGEVRRPAALPYWAHKRGIMTEDGLLVPTPRSKVPDAYSGATPAGSFSLTSRSDAPLEGTLRLMLELNQPWDWNEYWTNSRFPNDSDYVSSCQPAIVYEALIDFGQPGSTVVMKPIGHSHYAGKTGELFTDLSTITTALYIVEKIKVTVK